MKQFQVFTRAAIGMLAEATPCETLGLTAWKAPAGPYNRNKIVTDINDQTDGETTQWT